MMRHTPRKRPALAVPRRQRGFTLLLAMILILIMTVFGVFALNNSIMQARMSANFRDDKVSFEGAELALRWGETYLQSRTPAQRPFPCQALTDTSGDNCANPRQVVAAGLLVNDVSASNDDVEERDPWNSTDAYWANGRYLGENPDTAATFAASGRDNCTADSPTYAVGAVDTSDMNLRAGARGDRAYACQPRFIMAEAFVDRDDLAGNPQQGRVFYRIYAASTGERNSTLSVLESSVAKRFQ